MGLYPLQRGFFFLQELGVLSLGNFKLLVPLGTVLVTENFKLKVVYST